MATVFIKCLMAALFLSLHKNQRNATVNSAEHYLNVTVICTQACYNSNKQGPTFSDFDLSLKHEQRFLHGSRSDPHVFQI